MCELHSASKKGFWKVLSGDMAPVEIGFIESVQYLLKRKAPKCLDKSACPQSCVSPLKIHRHLVQLLAIMILIANSYTRLRLIFKKALPE